MPRIKRVVIPEIPHHITQRGNDRQKVFCDEADHQLYILGVSKHPFALAATFRRKHADYARYFNIESRRSGHVWSDLATKPEPREAGIES